jgi:hypothetical protein
MRARWYDAAVGRFVSEDPALRGANWFAYAEDRPTFGGDRTGRGLDPARIQAILQILRQIKAIWDSGTGEYIIVRLNALKQMLLGEGTVKALRAGPEVQTGVETGLGGGAVAGPVGELAGEVEELRGGTDAISAAEDVASAEEVDQVLLLLRVMASDE